MGSHGRAGSRHSTKPYIKSHIGPVWRIGRGSATRRTILEALVGVHEDEDGCCLSDSIIVQVILRHTCTQALPILVSPEPWLLDAPVLSLSRTCRSFDGYNSWACLCLSLRAMKGCESE
jgi:hypothetical protein